MLPIWFIYIAAALRIFGGAAYLLATVRGRTQPSPVSWLLWSIIPLIVFIAELQAGVGAVAIITLAVAASPLMVFLATIIKDHRSFQLKGFDLLCAIIAVGGIILWASTETPEIAIVAMIFADIVSALPTIKKLIKKPKSEFPPSFLLSALSMAIAIMTIDNWTFAAAVYPIYVLIINLFIYYLTTRHTNIKR